MRCRVKPLQRPDFGPALVQQSDVKDGIHRTIFILRGLARAITKITAPLFFGYFKDMLEALVNLIPIYATVPETYTLLMRSVSPFPLCLPRSSIARSCARARFLSRSFGSLARLALPGFSLICSSFHRTTSPRRSTPSSLPPRLRPPEASCKT